MSDLKGKVAVVTGGAGGLGAAIARFLARDGADIAIWDRKVDAAQEIANEISAMGRQVIVCDVDLSKRSDIEAAANKVREELGAVGILVNNAGISPYKPFVDITDDDWDAVMDVNLKGTFRCTQAVIGDMLEAKWGRIINISSSSAQTGAPCMAHYAATKGGVIGFTKALALEVAALGITVNNIPPNFIRTGPLLAMDDKIPGGLEGFTKNEIPVQRMGQPEDIANAAAFLASEASSYITGLTLGVNGGRVMQ